MHFVAPIATWCAVIRTRNAGAMTPSAASTLRPSAPSPPRRAALRWNVELRQPEKPCLSTSTEACRALAASTQGDAGHRQRARPVAAAIVAVRHTTAVACRAASLPQRIVRDVRDRGVPPSRCLPGAATCDASTQMPRDPSRVGARRSVRRIRDAELATRRFDMNRLFTAAGRRCRTREAPLRSAPRDGATLPRTRDPSVRESRE